MSVQRTGAELNKPRELLSERCIYVLVPVRGRFRWFHDDDSKEPYLPTVGVINFWKMPAKSGFPNENSSKNLLMRIERGEP